MTKTPNAIKCSDRKQRLEGKERKLEIFFRRHPYILFSIIFLVLPIILLIILGIAVCLTVMLILTVFSFF